MTSLLISSMRHSLLPGDIRKLLATSHKIFTLTQRITKRSDFKAISGHPLGEKDHRRLSYCLQPVGFPVSRNQYSVSAAVPGACGFWFSVSSGHFDQFTTALSEQSQC